MPSARRAKGAGRGRRSRTMGRTLVIAAACAAVFAAFAVTAHAAYTYYYALQAYASPGSGFGDNSVVYRNFNDSCAYVDIYHTHWTKSIYADANGNWLVWYEDNNNCGLGSKAHLNPSSDYGYTYVQAKCTNPSAHNSATFQMNCWTTRP